MILGILCILISQRLHIQTSFSEASAAPSSPSSLNHRAQTPFTATPPPSQLPPRNFTGRVRRDHNVPKAAKMVAKPGSVPDFGPLRELFKHHIESFDHMVDAGLETVVRHIKAVEVFDDLTSTKLRNILFLC